jgi:hypothetical protein
MLTGSVFSGRAADWAKFVNDTLEVDPGMMERVRERERSFIDNQEREREREGLAFGMHRV